MTKTKLIIYWIATAWLALGMLSTGIVQLLRLEGEVDFILQLGYPIYFVTLLGVSKIAGVVVILLPGFRLLKEWAYAGFVFTMAGALYSHLVSGHGFNDIFGPLLLLVLTGLSWYFRPDHRRIVPVSI